MTNNTFKVGDTASFTRAVSESDIYLFAEITGDMNLAHIDEEYAKDTVFGGRIAHGMLTAGFIGAVIAMKLLGPGTIYREQNLIFHAPVRIGDSVTTTVEIVELGKRGKTAKLKTTCINQEGSKVLDGYASVFLPRKRRVPSSA